MKSFLLLKKRKSKKQKSLCKFSLKIWIKLQLLPAISLHFFCVDLKNFPCRIRIQEGKWMRIRIHSPDDLEHGVRGQTTDISAGKFVTEIPMLFYIPVFKLQYI